MDRTNYLKGCRRCDKPFETNNIRKIYCSNTCKCMWLKENNLEFAEKVKNYKHNFNIMNYKKNKEIILLKNKSFDHSKRGNQKLTVDDLLFIFDRDNYTCQYCGKDNLKIGDGDLTIEHIIPLSKGGTNNLDNICVSCFSCNSKKFHDKGIKPKVISSGR